MVFNEALSFRSITGRYFVRHLDINDSTIQPITKLPFLAGEGPLQPSLQFVASGNIGTLLYLTRWFERMDIRTDHAVAQQISIQQLANKNLIFLGTKRTIPLLEKLNLGFNFEVEADGILNRLPDVGDPVPEKHDPATKPYFYLDNLAAPGPVWGLIQRTFNPPLKSWITLISSNNARFHEAAAHYLTQEELVAELVGDLDEASDRQLPRTFEALLEVEIEQHEENSRPLYRLKLLASRPIRTEKGGRA